MERRFNKKGLSLGAKDLFSDASIIEAQEGVACVAEDKHGKNAEDKVDGDDGYTHGGSIAVWDKHDENAEQGIGYVDYYSVICLDYEALEIYGVAFAFKFVFVKACKASELGNFILPRFDL